MPGSSARPRWRRLSLYLACYGMWAVLSALGLWTFLRLSQNVVDVSLMFSANPWVVDLSYKVGLILLILLWIGLVVFLESYLRDGIRLNRLWARATQVFLMLALLLGISYGLAALSPVAATAVAAHAAYDA